MADQFIACICEGNAEQAILKIKFRASKKAKSHPALDYAGWDFWF